MENNKERGVLVDKNDSNDKELFNDASKEIEIIDTTSERFRFKSSFEKALTIKRRFSKNQLQHLQIGLGIAYDVMKI